MVISDNVLHFTYWLKEVDQGTFLNDDDGKRGYLCGMEKGLHGCHDLVKATSKSTQSYNHVNLKKYKQVAYYDREAEFLGTIGKDEK